MGTTKTWQMPEATELIKRFAASIAVDHQEQSEIDLMNKAEGLLTRAFELGKNVQKAEMRTPDEIRQTLAIIEGLQPWNTRDIAVLKWVLNGPSPNATEGGAI